MSPRDGFTRLRFQHGDVTALQMRQAAKAFNFGLLHTVGAIPLPRSVAEHVLNGSLSPAAGYRGLALYEGLWPVHRFVPPKDGEQ